MSGTNDPLLDRLTARRSSPGVIDMAAIRAGTARFSSLGLGFTGTPLAARLLARGGGGGAAVAAGELIYRDRAAAGSDAPLADAGASPAPPPPDTLVTPRPDAAAAGAAPITPPTAAAYRLEDAGGSPPGPVQAGADMPVAPSLTAGILPSETDGAAILDDLATPAQAAGPASLNLPVVPSEPAAPAFADAGSGIGPGDLAELVLPRIAAARTAAAQSTAAGAAVMANAAAVPAIGNQGPVGAGAAFPPPGQATTLPTGLSSPAGGAMPGAPPAGSEFDEMTDQIARDLRRRLMVERERQGIPRWKR